MAELFDSKGRPKRSDIVETILHRLVGGALTEGGIQWSSEVATVDAATDYEVLSLTLDDGEHDGSSLVELEFSLTLALKAGSTTADASYKWQARNKGATWVDLHAALAKVDIGTAYIEYTVSGYRIAGATNLDTYPIEVRLVIQSNETTPGVATAKVKNSSYVGIKVR